MSRKHSGKNRKKLKIALLIFGAGAAVFLISQNADRLQELLRSAFEWVGRRGATAPLYFIAIYTLATFLLVPILFVNMAGGFLFGPVSGAFLVAFAALCSSGLCYLLSHYFLRHWMHGQIEKKPWLRVIDKVIKSAGWKIVLLTRLAPVCPFIPLNFAYGTSKIRWWVFLSASFIGFLPGAFLYAYLGSAAGSWIGVEAPRTARLPGEWLLLSLSAAAAILATLYMTKITRKVIAAGLL